MTKKIKILIGIAVIIIGGGILGYIQWKTGILGYIIKWRTCDGLEKLKSREFNKLDFSCQTDADCISIRGCGICANKNADTKRYEEIYNMGVNKGCIPLIDCPLFECKCLNNKCEAVKVVEVMPPISEIIIASPVKGETWIIGETYQIQWTPSDPTKTVGIILRDTRISDAGLSKVWQVENIPDTGIYSFTVPNLLPGGKYQIYISSQEKSGYSELFSIDLFSTVPPFSIVSPAETVDWRIYRGGAPGYESEIKYPKDWMINLSGPILYFEPEAPRLPENVVITMDIRLLQPGAFSPANFLKEPQEIYVNNSKWYYEDKRFYREDLETVLRTRTYISPNSDGSKVVTLGLIIRGGRQTKDYYLEDIEIKNELDILNRMASTFKFLEKIETQIICPQGFKQRYVTHPWRTENNEVVCLENMTASICVKCGNEICDKDEDWCICPEDCPKPKPEDLEFRKI